MKLNLLLLPLVAVTIIGTSSLLTYHVFSSSHPVVLGVEDHNDSVTLKLPDQEYVITTRDIDSLSGELIIPSYTDTTTQIAYDSNQGVISILSSPKDYVISVEDLRHDIASYVDKYPAVITPEYLLRDRSLDAVTQYNLRLNKIYRSPLSVVLKDGSTQVEMVLNTQVLRSIINPTTSELNIPPELDRQKLLDYITPRLSVKQKKYFNPDSAYQSTRRAIHSRFLGEATPLVLGVDDGPTSRGELAGKYLEVDLSQQKMYFFINKTLYKEYKISTGYEYPTPVGEFHILNKEPKAFSKIYNVWMPYWMAFKYAGDVKAYLGLHEIAYAVDEKGKPIYNHGYYIGDMMTGGCVAMEPKDSREIYNLSDVGMLVRVVK
jgi:lipoprotein-anchoring transpeptidase ErfK/SrfK